MTISVNEVTAVVAVIGLLLSIYNFYADRKDKTPRLAAKISNGFLAAGPETSEPMLFLEVANPGEKAVKVSAVELKWRSRKLIFFHGIAGTVGIPFELHPGHSATFWAPLKEVAVALKGEGVTGHESVRACFRTSLGSEFLSKKFKINVHTWARPH